MTFTPQDIQSKQFHVRMRGFDVEEVDGFLEKVAEEFLILTLENKQSLEKISTLEKNINSYKTKESSFQKAIMSAQKISDEMVSKTKRDSEALLAKAKEDAEQLKNKARQESSALQEKTRNETAALQEKTRNETAQIKAQAQDEARRLKTETENKMSDLRTEFAELQTMKDRIQNDLKQLLHTYLNRLDEDIPSTLENISTPSPVTFRPAEVEVEDVESTPMPAPVAEVDQEVDEDLSDLYEKINFMEENPTPEENQSATVLPSPDSEGADTLQTLDLGELSLEDDSRPDHASSLDFTDLDEGSDEITDLSLPDIEAMAAADDDLTIPDLDGDMLLNLQDPLDDLEPAISINREDKR